MTIRKGRSKVQNAQLCDGKLDPLKWLLERFTLDAPHKKIDYERIALNRVSETEKKYRMTLVD